VGLTFPDGVCFECSKCGLCCGDTARKTRRILLLKSEAKRIKKATNEQIGAFAVENLSTHPYAFEMLKTREGKCVFLKNNECTIYGQRPLICRFYPFELTTKENGNRVFRFTDECPAVCFSKAGKSLERDYFQRLLKLACVEFKEKPSMGEENRQKDST
jgi:Fe-S-cluster containining protein